MPFSIAPVLALRGQHVCVLVSGDPFWHGAGSLLAAQLQPGEWLAYPAPSTFSLAASRLGWAMEHTLCMALHAAPLARLRSELAHGRRIFCLLRDAAAPRQLATYLAQQGFAGSQLWVMERLGGPHERIRTTTAAAFAFDDIAAPVAVAILAQGDTGLLQTSGLPLTSGLPDDTFRHDGQITKQPVRALTLAALAPRRGERLWDIGAGSGSVSVEWCLAGGAEAISIERRPDRAQNIAANIAAFGLEGRMRLIEGACPAALSGLPAPDAVFIGGGADAVLLEALWPLLPAGCRMVVNAVTLETESLLHSWAAQQGGSLARFEMSHAEPLGRMRGWKALRPVVQWSVRK